MWNVFLNSDDARGTRRSIFSNFVRCDSFQKSLGVELLRIVPVLVACVEQVVVDEDYCVFFHTIAADL